MRERAGAAAENRLSTLPHRHTQGSRLAGWGAASSVCACRVRVPGELLRQLKLATFTNVKRTTPVYYYLEALSGKI